jgi:hypothetical protein
MFYVPIRTRVIMVRSNCLYHVGRNWPPSLNKPFSDFSVGDTKSFFFMFSQSAVGRFDAFQ